MNRLTYCPAGPAYGDGHTEVPTGEYVCDCEWTEEYGRVEVYACSACGTVYGLDRNHMFCPVPDDATV